MIQIISGVKGKGKTKYLIQMVNDEVKGSKGNIVYLDKNNKHMYELSNKIRLINVKDYPLDNYDSFLGFVCGLISQDHDLEAMYLDSFLSIACVTEEYVGYVLTQLEKISNTFHVNFVISVSIDAENLPEEFRDKIVISL
ncbi:MAG TPA: twitching motility protein PilT [Candidatus Scybalocola faecigallinarum]|uniref:Twitching motility protein PilT n=1 Tax=Candidatus Scybalocola faecigallinarum TaxID=2840941 RepID=A0A9D1F520_9FIRM|nr:twitching motility protein PilT [Candidatus Scybalocola faecigallinarum]